MSKSVTIECDLHVRRGRKGRHELGNGVVVSATELEPGRVPRVARLMALAIRFELTQGTHPARPRSDPGLRVCPSRHEQC